MDGDVQVEESSYSVIKTGVKFGIKSYQGSFVAACYGKDEIEPFDTGIGFHHNIKDAYQEALEWAEREHYSLEVERLKRCVARFNQ